MRKTLFWIFCIAIFSFIFGELLFASTAFFTTKDGRVFCETDTFDGSYRICTKKQSTGTGLVKAEKYNPRLVDTTTGKICVEDGKETDPVLCQEPPPKINVATTTGTTINTPTTSTGNTTATSSTIVPLPDTISGSTVTTTATSTTTPDVVLTPVVPAIPVVEASGALVDNGFIASVVVAYTACTGHVPKLSCPKAIGKMTDAFIGLGTMSVIGIGILFLTCTIFWFNMISHAFANPIPIKPIWIILLLVLSVPGAVLYYFAGLRPYEAKVLASLPPRPPSFFY